MTTTTALLIITALSVTCSFLATVLITVTLRQALQDSSLSRVRSDERRDAQLSALLDRFQAIRWEELVAMRAIESADQEGGFLSPAEQREEASTVVEDEQVRWGPLSRLQVSKEQKAAEEALLKEDFPEDYPSRTEVRDENR